MPNRVAESSRRSFVAGSALFGFGLGGLMDGIVLHQLLQWHHLVSSKVTTGVVPGLRTNVFWDGVFHLATALVLLGGFALLWGAWRRPPRGGRLGELVGIVLVGWGAFHVVDQLVFHLLLGLHDIREAVEHPGLYNWGYFVLGLVIAAVGVTALRRSGSGREEGRA